MIPEYGKQEFEKIQQLTSRLHAIEELAGRLEEVDESIGQLEAVDIPEWGVLSGLRISKIDSDPFSREIGREYVVVSKMLEIAINNFRSLNQEQIPGSILKEVAKTERDMRRGEGTVERVRRLIGQEEVLKLQLQAKDQFYLDKSSEHKLKQVPSTLTMEEWPEKEVSLDPDKLLFRPFKFPASLSHIDEEEVAAIREWELNFGLLHSAYQRTTDTKTRASIRFLMVNYLVKAALISIKRPIFGLSKESVRAYNQMLQTGIFADIDGYSRGTLLADRLVLYFPLEKKIESKLIPKLIVTERTDVNKLFPLAFVTTPDISRSDEIVRILVEQFEAHRDMFPDKNMEFPVLIDVTEQIGESSITEHDAAKEELYRKKEELLRHQILEIVDKALGIIKKKYPDDRKIQEQTKNYLLINLAVVSRARIDDQICIVNLHDNLLREDEDFVQKSECSTDRIHFLREHFEQWANQAAVDLSIVKLDGVETSRFIRVKGKDVQKQFPLSFVITPDISEKRAIVSILVSLFEENKDKFLSENMRLPVLIDVTVQMDGSSHLEGDEKNMELYRQREKQVHKQLLDIVYEAYEIISKKYPLDDPSIQMSLPNYFLTNIAIVSIAKIDGQETVIDLHPDLLNPGDFFPKKPPSFDREVFLKSKIVDWANHTASGFGAVNFRHMYAEHEGEKLMSQGGIYAVPGKTDVMIYPTVGNILDTHEFQTLCAIADGIPLPAKAGIRPNDSPIEVEIGEAQRLFAKATVQMMETLLLKIGDENWEEMQKDPAIRELTQTVMHRIMLHLQTAVMNVHNFRKFYKAIDAAHAEFTAFLVLYHPFDPSTFEETYRRFLNSIDIYPTSIGLAKSAMNVFAGVNSAVLKDNPNPVRICAGHSYYEEVLVVGRNSTLDETLADDTIDKVDLYVGEIYHNIVKDSKYTNYKKGTLIEDIERIFTEKPLTDRLTVTIDATIDLANSEDLKELLRRFSDKISQGKLNIVVFRSGQKFDMMGLDNYFGSPFYIINNGDEKWNSFRSIQTDKIYRTDKESQQFFTWMAEAGPDLIDEYKTKIFQNARAILDIVPDSLKPEEGKKVCVSTFESDVKTSFIEISIDLQDKLKSNELLEWTQEHFIKLMMENDKLAYRRSSFGFPHANILQIENKLRINPGVDPDEINVYEQLFLDLEAKLKELRL